MAVISPRTDIGGGARILFEHASRLADRGHSVVVVAHGPAPHWFGLRCDYISVPYGLDLVDALPDVDVVLAGYWEQIRAARAAAGVPVLHLEQGDFHLFEDITPDLVERARLCLQAADKTLTLSAEAQRVLSARYDVESALISNAVDRTVFRPDGPHSSGFATPYLVCVGWDGNAFKGHDLVRAAWARLRFLGHDVDIVRISPRPVLQDWGHVIVAPEQSEMAALLRGATAFVGASRYEAWGLPALEAMSSGTPVVSTAHGGIMEYAEDGRDALLVPIDDTEALVQAVERVITDQATASVLREGGLATAARFDWDRVVTQMEEALRELSAGPAEAATEWNVEKRYADLLDTDGAARFRRRLATTSASVVEVPVLRKLLRGIVHARWETIARRRTGSGVSRLYTPIRLAGRPRGKQAAVQTMILTGRASQALPKVLADAKAARGEDMVTKSRWLTLALLHAGHTEAALEVAASGLETNPDQPDFARLAAMASTRLGNATDAATFRALAEVVGIGARYDEWFMDLPPAD